MSESVEPKFCPNRPVETCFWGDRCMCRQTVSIFGKMLDLERAEVDATEDVEKSA